MDNDRLIEVNPLFEDIAVKQGFYSRDLMALIAEHGSVHGVEGVPERRPARVRHRARHRARMARPDAGRVPEVTPTTRCPRP